ncbi:MAG: hypothetical protein WCI47_03410 [bacterium]
MKQPPYIKKAWDELSNATPEDTPAAFVELCNEAFRARLVGDLSLEDASYQICGAIMNDQLEDTPEFERVIDIACQLELPAQHRSLDVADEERSWDLMQKLISDYSSGKREGITQRIRLTAEKYNNNNQIIAGMGGWIVVKYGRPFIQIGDKEIHKQITELVRHIDLDPDHEHYLATVQKKLDRMTVSDFTIKAEVVNHMRGDGHSDYHSNLAFCGSAGPEEMRHLETLLEILSDEELRTLVARVGITFTHGDEDLVRDDLEGVIDEAAREDFYREYTKLIESRKK